MSVVQLRKGQGNNFMPPSKARGVAVAIVSGNTLAVIGPMSQQSFATFVGNMQTAMKGKGHDE